MSADNFQPRDFRRSLREAGITATEYRVAVELCEHANAGKPVVWPAIDTLADYCQVGRSTVIRALNQLEAKELIACAGNRNGGRGKPTRWKLCALKGVTDATVSEERVSSETERVSNPALNHVTGDTRRSKEEANKEGGAPIPEEPPPKTCTDHPNWNDWPCLKCKRDKNTFQTWLTDSRQLLDDLERQRDESHSDSEAAAISDQRRKRIAVFQRIGEAWR